MGAPRVRVWAPAKVNLYLAVGPVRTDGYHDVTTVLTAVDLADDLLIEPSDTLTVSCTPDIGVPAEENLVHRAAVALGARVGRVPTGHISVTKRIPHGAGLGGGSSDAAAALVGLARLWGVNITLDALEDVAAGLGADVAFFLRGGPALYVSRGDRFVSTMTPAECDVVIVKPPVSVPTGAAYATFDRLQVPEPPGPARLEQALAAGDCAAIARALYNNMTPASAQMVPVVGEAAEWLTGCEGVHGAAMAGSGSAVFGMCENAHAATACAADARSRGWWAVATRLVADGVRVSVEGGGR